MRQHLSREDSTHWEGLIRAVIDQIGPEALAEVIEYVVTEMRAEQMRLRNFAIEMRRAAGQ